ncbi:3-deoxy-D-manno-octulosonic acid transferase [bacterium]|nr:3-deoxy-D-manno-octulosonic acid transferase [bacterium]
MLRLIYNLLFDLGFLLSAPHYFGKMLRRGNWRQDFGQRFARYSPEFKQSISGKPVIWFHAVSVGEVGLCVRLLQELQDELSDYTVVASTTTSTGMGELKRRTPKGTRCMYYPVDRWSHIQRALNLLEPKAVILVEAEIWPNILWALRERAIPTFLVNARLSDRSFKGYARFGFLFRPLFEAFTGIGSLNEKDKAKLISLGCPENSITVTGSMKFDSATTDGPKSVDVPVLLKKVGIPENATLLVAGSTHDGEELILAQITNRLRKEFPKLVLIVVPRHFERGADIYDQLRKSGINTVQRSRIQETSSQPKGDHPECFLVDSTGELKWFYEHADIAFIGKSLTAKGGQNPIEPGAFSKPIVFGPNMQNFRDIISMLLDNNAAVQVKDKEELESTLRQLLADPDQRTTLGRNARHVVTKNQGATERTCQMIREALERSSTEENGTDQGT